MLAIGDTTSFESIRYPKCDFTKFYWWQRRHLLNLLFLFELTHDVSSVRHGISLRQNIDWRSLWPPLLTFG